MKYSFDYHLHKKLLELELNNPNFIKKTSNQHAISNLNFQRDFLLLYTVQNSAKMTKLSLNI